MLENGVRGYGLKFLYVATFWPLRSDDCGPFGDTARGVPLI